MTRKLQIKGLLVAGIFAAGSSLFAQVQYNQLDDFGTAIMDINNQGHGVLMGGYYDFATNALTPPETGVYGTAAINDNDDVLGMMDDGAGNIVPGMRVGGVWTAFPSSVPLTEDDTLYDVSENGIWVVGQTGWDPGTDTAWGFIYNTDTQEFRLLESALYEYSAAYAVNNDGYAVGWVDDLPSGTLRMPAVFNPDGSITLLGEDDGEGAGISNNGKVVGRFMGQPFIYDMATDTMESFNLPADAFTAAFASISDNGIAFGYAEYPGFARLPIIYHPDLGADPQLLSDVLTGFGIDASELAGTGYKISSDGNYVCGFTDGPAFMAMGWAVFFDGQLIDSGSEDPCEEKTVMECNVEYTAELIPNAGVWTNYPGVSYNYPGSEKVWEFTAPVSGTYTFDLNQGTQDADFFLMDSCGNTGVNILGWYWTGEENEQIDLEEGVTYYLIADLYQSASQPTTVTVKVECPEMGVNDMSSFDFAYYPNPVKDVLNIKSQKTVKSVEAYNMAGQQVISTKTLNGQIDLTSLSAGTYVFKAVLEGGQVETFKVIKK
ncbi:MAG: T9SS type A sorting domain-containing protein [Moheibacter sp.]